MDIQSLTIRGFFNVRGGMGVVQASCMDISGKGLPDKISRQAFVYKWCPEPGSNRHVQRTRDFKSLASTNFAIGAVALKSREYIDPHSMKQARKILK
jgi:hypothetical protein